MPYWEFSRPIRRIKIRDVYESILSLATARTKLLLTKETAKTPTILLGTYFWSNGHRVCLLLKRPEIKTCRSTYTVFFTVVFMQGENLSGIRYTQNHI